MPLNTSGTTTRRTPSSRNSNARRHLNDTRQPNESGIHQTFSQHLTMAVPLLPHRVRSSPIIGPQYEAWKAQVLADGLDDKAIKHEFYTIMKPRWIEQQRQNEKFEADTEKLRKKTDANRESTEHLRTASQHRFAIPIALQGGTLTPLEVHVYRSESGHPPYNRLMRDPQSIVIRTPLVRPDWLGTNGFLVDSLQFIKFITLLYAETMATVPNQQAAGLYELLTSNNHDGKSAFKRIVLRTGKPVPFNPVHPLMAELPHAHGDAMLSHKFLTTTLATNAFGTPQFLPSKTLTGAAQEYPAASEILIQNDCAYRCILESFKNSWDAWEAKKRSQRKKPGKMCLLDHGFLRTVFGKTDDDYSLKIHELGKFFSEPKRKLSCVVVDDWGNIIWKKVWETQNDNITLTAYSYRPTTSTSTFCPVGMRTCEKTQWVSRRRWILCDKVDSV